MLKFIIVKEIPSGKAWMNILVSSLFDAVPIVSSWLYFFVNLPNSSDSNMNEATDTEHANFSVSSRLLVVRVDNAIVP